MILAIIMLNTVIIVSAGLVRIAPISQTKEKSINDFGGAWGNIA
jgi:hypothetical protein